MIVDFEAGDLRLTDNNLIPCFFCLEVTKGASCGQSSRKHSQWPSNHVVVILLEFGDGSGLVDLAACLEDPLLFFKVRGLVILGDLVAFLALLAQQYCS